MAKIKKLLHTRYRVNDLEKTVAFYRDVLGLQETGRQKSPRGSELVFLKAPESEEEIELCSYPSAGPVQGVKLSDGPTRASADMMFAFVDAPEGYEIELIQRSGK